MEKSENKNIWKYLILGGALGVSYLLVQYFSKAKSSKVKPLSLQKTQRILKEIKYQMLTTSASYAEAVSKKPKGHYSEEDLEIAFRTEMAKICEGREEAVLGKHNVSRDEYSASLDEFKKNSKIQQQLVEILQMMERSIKGRIPDLSVPPQASRFFSNSELLAVYLEMCELIAVKIWEKLNEHKQKNPGFNSREELHYKKAMKQVSIYDIKSNFLLQKGFQQAWGTPNEIFFKLLEAVKQKSKESKEYSTSIEKAFDKVVEKVSSEPESFNAQRIKFLMEESLHEAKNSGKQGPIQQVPPVKSPAVSRSLGQAVPPKKKEDEQFSMENLMMQELLNRSAEEPKEQVSEKKIEQSKPETEKNQSANFEESKPAEVEESKPVEIEEKKSSEVEENKSAEVESRKEENKAEETEKKPEIKEVAAVEQQKPIEEKSQQVEENVEAEKEQKEPKQVEEEKPTEQVKEVQIESAKEQSKPQEPQQESKQQPKPEESKEEVNEEPQRELEEQNKEKQEENVAQE